MLDGVGEKFYVRSRTTKSANRATHQFGWFKAQHIGIVAVNIENGVWKVFQDSDHSMCCLGILYTDALGTKAKALDPASPFEFGGRGWNNSKKIGSVKQSVFKNI
jgi:hypothetical protein